MFLKIFFKRDFSDVEDSDQFTKLLEDESLKASKLTQSVINQSRGFFLDNQNRGLELG